MARDKRIYIYSRMCIYSLYFIYFVHAQVTRAATGCLVIPPPFLLFLLFHIRNASSGEIQAVPPLRYIFSPYLQNFNRRPICFIFSYLLLMGHIVPEDSYEFFSRVIFHVHVSI